MYKTIYLSSNNLIFLTYWTVYETYFPTHLVTKVKPSINPVEDHSQLY